MRIFLFPYYVDIEWASRRSPKLFKFLSEEHVQLTRVSWRGDIKSLPVTPSIIRASSMSWCKWEELAQRCAELGHFCFYNDFVLMPDGTISSEQLIDEAKKFLERQAMLEKSLKRVS